MKSMIIAAFALLASPAAAQLAEARLSSVRVSVADLDVSRTEGSRALDQRLKTAVRSVCSDLDARDLYRKSAYRQCLAIARQSAQAGRDALVARASGQAPQINFSQ